MAIALPPAPLVERPPKLDGSVIPVDQRDAFQHITELLHSLATFEEHFLLALALFDGCAQEQQAIMGRIIQQNLGMLLDQKAPNDILKPALESEPVLGGWRELAARSGAIAIYHFGVTIIAINQSLPTCAVWNDKVDRSELKNARKLFEAGFPRYEAIRHVVAHASDFTASIAQKLRHSRKGAFKATVDNFSVEISGQQRFTQFTGNLYQDAYMVSFEGEVHGYSISKANAERLKTIKAKIYAAVALPMVMPAE